MITILQLLSFVESEKHCQISCILIVANLVLDKDDE